MKNIKNETDVSTTEQKIDKKRRKFMATATKAAIVAPAVTLLLTANMKQANAYGTGTQAPVP